MKTLVLTNRLFSVYLKDETERANTEGIAAIAQALGADIGALFYRNAKNMYKFCLDKSGFPISIPESRWRASIPDELRDASALRFRSWNPPGIDVPVEYWLSRRLDVEGMEPSYLFLGRNATPWTDDEDKTLAEAAAVIAEIVGIRFARDVEIQNRQDAQDELKLIQTRMSTFFESSRDTIYTLDPEERFTSVNRAGLAMFGVEAAESIIGQPFSRFTTNPETRDFFHEQIRANGYIDDFEIVIRRPDGSLIYCLETAHAVTNASGDLVEIQGQLKDITERIKNERKLWAVNFELTKLNQDLKNAQAMIVQQEKLASIGQLAAGVAHEINNPLGFLKSNQTMLKSYFDSIMSFVTASIATTPGLADEYRAKDLDYVQGEAANIFRESAEGFERIKYIVSHLVTFARASGNDDFAECDIDECIETTLSVARNETKYVAEIKRKKGPVPKIMANQGEINQVLLNILVNAAQAIAGQKRDEKGSILIESGTVNGKAFVRISDDGPGMSEEVQSRIFDPFYTTKEPGKGTGLGLSISYDIIVNKHHGQISVDSQPGMGASFTIVLPVTQEAAPSAMTEAEPAGNAEPEAEPLSPD